jgi:2,3-bisphosphoglycerate-independent phosphoglycerate mutase
VEEPKLGVSGHRPIVLIILDGWGISPQKQGNAIKLAHLPEMTRLWKNCPHTTLHASDGEVGLPEGVMGNSEVGHLNIGAGRLVFQDLVRINNAIKTGEFFHNKTLNHALEHAKTAGKSVHFMGLLSDGGVHSDITHLYALLELAKKTGCPKVWVHPFTDGRDMPPQSAQTCLEALEEEMQELSVGKIGTLSGRYYSMDRDRRWDRTAKAYYAIALGEGIQSVSAQQALNKA